MRLGSLDRAKCGSHTVGVYAAGPMGPNHHRGTSAMSPSIEEARQKYAAEREKRLRSDGTAQYSALAGMYEEFNRDP